MTDYDFRISYAASDPEWDAFVESTPGGHHVQTSMWARVKSSANLCAARVVVADRHEIVGGAQILMRVLPPVGALAYVTKAPLCASADTRVLRRVIDGLHALASKHHLQYLAVQPPNNGEPIAAQLPRLGFRRSSVELASAATVVLDVSSSLDELWAGMKTQNRQNIRRAERDGIVIREGKEDDVPVFYRLHLASSQRQGFVPYSENYYLGMWRTLEPAGYIKLLLAEYQGEAVSALLLVPFAGTVIAKKLGWGGACASRRPNQLLFWKAIEWTKAHGYRYFDFEGIEPQGARAALAGEPLPKSLLHTHTRFKLMFGGQVVFYPGSYDYVYNPLIRWAFGKLTPDLNPGSTAARMIDRLRQH